MIILNSVVGSLNSFENQVHLVFNLFEEEIPSKRKKTTAVIEYLVLDQIGEISQDQNVDHLKAIFFNT